MRIAQKLRHSITKVGGWKRIDGGPMKGKVHPRKGISGLWSMSEESKAKMSIAAVKREAAKRLAKQGLK